MKSDPPVREDGKCVTCGGDRKIGRAEAETDPFCSIACCRAYYGCSLPEVVRPGKPRKYEPKAHQRWPGSKKPKEVAA